jgi:hypothetical protein
MSHKLFTFQARSANTDYNPNHQYNSAAYSDSDLQNDYSYFAYDSVCMPTPKNDVEGIVTVGYCGLRVVGRNNGTTWSNETNWDNRCGDDSALLRSVAYGNGVWVAMGWWLTTSTDGINWTSPLAVQTVTNRWECGWISALTFGKGKFLAVCDSNVVLESSDGSDWKSTTLSATKLDPAVGSHKSVFFDAITNQFVVTGDNARSFTSADGITWTEISTAKARLCIAGITPQSECPAFWHDGYFLRQKWAKGIERSTNGVNWMQPGVLQLGTPNDAYTFAVGKVAK